MPSSVESKRHGHQFRHARGHDRQHISRRSHGDQARAHAESRASRRAPRHPICPASRRQSGRGQRYLCSCRALRTSGSPQNSPGSSQCRFSFGSSSSNSRGVPISRTIRWPTRSARGDRSWPTLGAVNVTVASARDHRPAIILVFRSQPGRHVHRDHEAPAAPRTRPVFFSRQALMPSIADASRPSTRPFTPCPAARQ